jgi:TIR domain
MSGRVFISHAGADAHAAHAVAECLRSAGLAPLLDRERIGAGDSFLSFMEDALATSDYFLLLWSSNAASRKWVQIEWEAALHRSVSDARGFLVVGRLDPQPLPILLAPRLFVDLHPELMPGLAELVRMWREDLRAEEQSGRPVASNQSLSQPDTGGVPVYITSELFGVVVPVSIDLSVPAGVVLLNVTERLSLPRSLDHQGVVGVRFDYRLLLNQLPLDIGTSLEGQGVKAGSVLLLECNMRPFAAKAPQSGTLEAVTFRSGSPEFRALRSAQRRLAAAVLAADLGKTPVRQKRSSV